MLSNFGAESPSSVAPQYKSNRSILIQRALHAAMDATYGTQQLTEHELNQLLGELVKAQLLTADQSYQFRDLLFDRGRFARYVDQRAKEVIRDRRIESQTLVASA